MSVTDIKKRLIDLYECSYRAASVDITGKDAFQLAKDCLEIYEALEKYRGIPILVQRESLTVEIFEAEEVLTKHSRSSCRSVTEDGKSL